jgi:sec-independent protein translocase protein TatA
MMFTHCVDLKLAFGWPGGPEWIVLLVLGLLIFGKRLPDVGRSIGRSIVEFKRGIKGIEDDIDDESKRDDRKLPKNEYRDLPLDASPDEVDAARTSAQQKEESARK